MLQASLYLSKTEARASCAGQQLDRSKPRFMPSVQVTYTTDDVHALAQSVSGCRVSPRQALLVTESLAALPAGSPAAVPRAAQHGGLRRRCNSGRQPVADAAASGAPPGRDRRGAAVARQPQGVQHLSCLVPAIASFDHTQLTRCRCCGDVHLCNGRLLLLLISRMQDSLAVVTSGRSIDWVASELTMSGATRPCSTVFDVPTAFAKALICPVYQPR